MEMKPSFGEAMLGGSQLLQSSVLTMGHGVALSSSTEMAKDVMSVAAAAVDKEAAERIMTEKNWRYG